MWKCGVVVCILLTQLFKKGWRHEDTELEDCPSELAMDRSAGPESNESLGETAGKVQDRR